ncbi:MAG TPA: alpha/beta hydrolase [Bryobacteraceae bacterium]|nr:alpha/beta hydrolase [Bryobacteraceae bacterium]
MMLRVFVLALLAGISALAAHQPNPAAPDMPGQLIEVRDHRVHIYCAGQGSPTVVVASGGFSFDWGLVQPQIAQVTRICTYDPAGMAWSDPVPAQTAPYCSGRVDELRQLLANAGVQGPYVLVGYSIGGLVARLYSVRYLNEILGVVFVDHAFIDTPNDSESKPPPSPLNGVDSPPVLISQSPIALDLEDDQNFSKLPDRDQQLHKWALLHSLRPTPEMAAECLSEVEKAEQKQPFPLGKKPVAVVSTLYNSPRYRDLQDQLLRLSENSKQFIAENSSHMVIIDRPDIVIQAIREVVAAARKKQAFTQREH